MFLSDSSLYVSLLQMKPITNVAIAYIARELPKEQRDFITDFIKELSDVGPRCLIPRSFRFSILMLVCKAENSDWVSFFLSAHINASQPDTSVACELLTTSGTNYRISGLGNPTCEWCVFVAPFSKRYHNIHSLNTFDTMCSLKQIPYCAKNPVSHIVSKFCTG